MTGIDTASDEPQRKRVTGGILRISSQKPVYDIAKGSGFGPIIITKVGFWGRRCGEPTCSAAPTRQQY